MPLHFKHSPRGAVIENLPGVAEGVAEGPPELLDALLSGDSTERTADWRQPLRISLRFEKAVTAVYSLWAFRAQAEADWLPRFPPFEVWRSRLPDPLRGRPFLLVSRAQGRWDRPADFGPEWARLLQEKDLLGTPDGRVLVCASPPAMPLCASLHAAIRWFLDSLAPLSREPLPANCLLIRSGSPAASWDLPFPAAVLVSPGGRPAAGRHGPPLSRIPLARGLRVQLEWTGPLLWGAWRIENEAQRFLTTGYRAGPASRVAISVRIPCEAESRALFHAALLGAAGGITIARGTSDSLLDRALRAIRRNIEGSRDIRLATETPYAGLLRVFAQEHLPISEAAALPAVEAPEPSGRDRAGNGEASREVAGPRCLLEELGQPREVRMVFSDAGANPRDRAVTANKPVPCAHEGERNAA